MTTITSSTRTQVDYATAVQAARNTNLTDAEAVTIAAAWQSPGRIGHVLSQLASTGSADADDIQADIDATRRAYAATTLEVHTEMHALTLWVRAKLPGHGLLEDDILAAHWGYDQTNVTYYTVLAATATTVTVQRIAAQETSDGPQTMTGTSTPDTGQVIGEPMRRKVYDFGGSPHVRIEAGEIAQLWNGRPQSFSTYA